MAKTNLFRAYGGSRNDESKRPIEKEKLDFISAEVGEVLQEELQSTPKTEAPIEPKKEESETKETKESSNAKKGKGRPAHNPGVTTALRTYKIAEEAIDAMEQKMFEHRKDWDKRMSLSKYITNLIWADTHNGELFFDPETAKCLVNLEEEDF